ncbi:MAG TPA: hypothetical protein PLP17_15615, partial [Oligoflexia bacterium]|nr:hypothetical protein [Oligoflexia bacterium]
LAIACAVISAVVGLFGMAAREQYSRIPQAEYKMDREASMSKQQAVMPSSPFPRQGPAEKWAPKSGLSYLAEDEGRSTGAIEDKLQRLKQADPKAIVQTGPGVPSWSWKKWTLNWNGPVKRNQHLKLYLLSPGQNAFLSVLRVLLLTALASLFVRRRDVGTGSTAGAALLMVSVIFAPPAAYAQTQQFPGPDLLQELENRLLNARCTSGCTTLETLSLEIDGQEVKIQAAAASDGSGAVALPGPFDQFLPERILVDGAETSAIRRDERGLLWVRVANGTHSVSASGRLIPSSTVMLQFGSAPKRVLVHAPAWDVDGISETGSVGSSLQLIRKSGSAVKTGETEKQEVLLPPWFIVERRLDLGIPWTVRTKVLRLGNTERAQLVKIPLVHGEAVNNPDVKVEKGEVLL